MTKSTRWQNLERLFFNKSSGASERACKHIRLLEMKNYEVKALVTFFISSSSYVGIKMNSTIVILVQPNK